LFDKRSLRRKGAQKEKPIPAATEAKARHCRRPKPIPGGPKPGGPIIILLLLLLLHLDRMAIALGDLIFELDIFKALIRRLIAVEEAFAKVRIGEPVMLGAILIVVVTELQRR